MAQFIWDKDKDYLINLDLVESIAVEPERAGAKGTKYIVKAWITNNENASYLGYFETEAKAWDWITDNIPIWHYCDQSSLGVK